MPAQAIATQKSFNSDTFFSAGMSSYARGEKITDFCKKILDFKRVICEEGYYFKKWEKKQFKNQKIEILESELEALGLGMAVASRGEKIEEIKLHTTDLYRKYIFDGFGFYSAVILSIRKSSLIGCEAMQNESLRKYCNWGFGRGIYYSKSDLHKPVNQEIVNGYQFASGFLTEKPKEVTNQKLAGLIDNVKLYYKCEKEGFCEKPRNLCWHKKHISDCISSL